MEPMPLSEQFTPIVSKSLNYTDKSEKAEYENILQRLGNDKRAKTTQVGNGLSSIKDFTNKIKKDTEEINKSPLFRELKQHHKDNTDFFQ
jgi:hypothetical protein